MTGPAGAFPCVRPAGPSGPGPARPPATGARTDTSVTHNSRPAPAAPVLGTITGATAVSTDHSVELSASAPGGALGSAYSLASAGSRTDSPRVRSGEAGSAAPWPQLESHLRS